MDPTRREALLKEYSEVGSNFRLLTDIRFKLLGFLPIAAAAAAALKGDNLSGKGFVLSLFGLVATLGVAAYNERNDQLYDALVERAASIERSLGLLEGYFANRPRPWLSVPLLGWPLDHRNGVTTIYAASIALWAFGVLAPFIQFVSTYHGALDHLAVTVVVNIIALVLAIGLTVLGVATISRHKDGRRKELRELAREAVETAAEIPVESIAQYLAQDADAAAGIPAKIERLFSLCVNLSGETGEGIREKIRSRARFYTDAKSARYYLAFGSQDVTAAHMVALLTDLPPGWLLDCKTNRRGALPPLVNSR